jgi:hypothetical protein
VDLILSLIAELFLSYCGLMKTLYAAYSLLLSFLHKKSVSLILSLLICTGIIGQPPTAISGVVNTYHKVVEIVPAQACVIVSNVSGLSVNTRVMIVQMKGASINTSNTSAFGDVTAMNEAGNYEIGTICNIKSDSVFLFHTLLNTYTPLTGKVQLVQFAEYLSANVVDTVKAMPWDSVKGTGGVIAIYANNTIFLNAPVYADSSGYRGGIFLNHSGACNLITPAGTGFAYDASAAGAQNGAYKGEGISNVPAALDGAKGAPANGGGGGNNHNNSGGGGANLSTGGNGGGNRSTGPIGCNTGGNQGRGGKALSSSGGTRIFMGGGGGAGHANNGSASLNYGGNGGGLIFIWANDLIGNGNLVTANGGTGGASTADGAGGGGSGGTIIMHVSNYTGSAVIRSNGGNGGLSDNGFTNARCFGGGGGGSGGAIYFTGPIPAVTVAANSGAGGLEINPFNCSNPPIPGIAGSNGSIFSNYTFTRSINPASFCGGALPLQLLFFNAVPIEKKAKLHWQVTSPELAKSYTIEKMNNNNEWVSLVTINENLLQQEYIVVDNKPNPGNNLYRLKIIQKENSVIYSQIRRLFINDDDFNFIVYPNPAVNRITVTTGSTTGAQLKLLDITGKLILQQQLINNKTDINLPPLSPGIYLLRINEKNQKLIIR